MAATLAPLPSALLALGPPSLMMLFAPVAAATNSTPTAAKATRGAVTATKTANPAALSLQVWDTRYGMLHSALDADMAETPLEALLMSVLCGGGRTAAIAFRGAVLALSVPPPTTPFGLAQALGAMARTSAALAPDDGVTLMQPQARSAAHVSALLEPSHVTTAVTPDRPVALGAEELRRWDEGAAARDAFEPEVLAELFSGSRKHTPKSFEEAISRHLHRMRAHTPHAERSGLSAIDSSAGGFAEGEADADAEQEFDSGLGARPALTVSQVASAQVSAAARKRQTQLETSASTALDEGKRRSSKRARKGAMEAVVQSTAEAEAEGKMPSPNTLPLTPPAVSANFVSQVCARCISHATAGWLRPLRPLLASGAVRGSLCPTLLPALCAAHSLELLVLYVRHVPDLDDEELFLLLRLSLREHQASQQQAAAQTAKKRAAGDEAQKKARKPAEGESGWEELLDHLICSPRNDVALLQALRWLSLADGLLLFDRLLELLGAYKQRWTPPAGSPSLAQLVGWLNVLLDAHASQLLMHAPALAPLTQLGDLARRHVQLCSSVKALKGHLSQATLHGAQPTRPVPPYSVELITL